MNSDEKRPPSGGSGGGNHIDKRIIDGEWIRNANYIQLASHPPHDGQGTVALFATGPDSVMLLRSQKSVAIMTGAVADKDSADISNIGWSGVTLHAPGAQVIQLYRGDLNEPDSQRILMKADGEIIIDAGETGSITLQAGPGVTGSSYIKITPTGITIKGTLVQIN
jgi:hypothetical protein